MKYHESWGFVVSLYKEKRSIALGLAGISIQMHVLH